MTDSKGGTTSSTYDDDGRLSRQTFTDGTKTLRMDLTYNGNDQVSTQTRFSDLGGTTTVAYSEYDHDDAGQITSIVHKDVGNNILDDFTYSFNAAGRLTQEVRGTVTSNFGYDDAGQLTSDASNSYGFDAAGNRNTNGFAATTGNRMTTDGIWTFAYDNEGNQTRKDHISTSFYWTYDYGNKNELLAAKYYNAGGILQKEVQYKYDALGNRIQKDYITGGVTTTTRFAVDGWNPAKAGSLGSSAFDVWADLDAGNTLMMRFMRGDSVDEIWAEIGATAYWTLTDRMGSVSDIVNQSGQVKNQVVFDGFGRIVSQTDSNYGSRYKYTGREWDVEAELQYNRARYYDPSTGRWISQDPLGFDAGDSNLYRYVKNTPTVKRDPSGLKRQPTEEELMFITGASNAESWRIVAQHQLRRENQLKGQEKLKGAGHYARLHEDLAGIKARLASDLRTIGTSSNTAFFGNTFGAYQMKMTSLGDTQAQIVTQTMYVSQIYLEMATTLPSYGDEITQLYSDDLKAISNIYRTLYNDLEEEYKYVTSLERTLQKQNPGALKNVPTITIKTNIREDQDALIDAWTEQMRRFDKDLPVHLKIAQELVR